VAERRRRKSAHAAGIGAAVAIQQALVVLGRGHQGKIFTIREGQQRDFGADETLFNDYLTTSDAEFTGYQHRFQGDAGFCKCIGQDDALTRREARGLKHQGESSLLDVIPGWVKRIERCPCCGGDVMTLHQ